MQRGWDFLGLVHPYGESEQFAAGMQKRRKELRGESKFKMPRYLYEAQKYNN